MMIIKDNCQRDVTSHTSTTPTRRRKNQIEVVVFSNVGWPSNIDEEPGRTAGASNRRRLVSYEDAQDLIKKVNELCHDNEDDGCLEEEDSFATISVQEQRMAEQTQDNLDNTFPDFLQRWELQNGKKKKQRKHKIEIEPIPIPESVESDEDKRLEQRLEQKSPTKPGINHAKSSQTTTTPMVGSDYPRQSEAYHRTRNESHDDTHNSVMMPTHDTKDSCINRCANKKIEPSVMTPKRKRRGFFAKLLAH
jgi:hypothetical protein